VTPARRVGDDPLDRARALCASGRAAEAEAELLALFPQLPLPPPARFGLALAHCNLSLERLEAAEACLARVRHDHGDDPELLTLLVAVHRRRGEVAALPALAPRLQPFLDRLPMALLWLTLLQDTLDADATLAWADQLRTRWPDEVVVRQTLLALAWDLQDAERLQAWGGQPLDPLSQARLAWLEGREAPAIAGLQECLQDHLQAGADPAEGWPPFLDLLERLPAAQRLELAQRQRALWQNDPEATWTVGRCLLAAHHWSQGWALYEARRFGAFRAQIIPPGFPCFGFETPPAGRRVLLYGEQGVGDIILFASMLPDLLADAAAVTLLMPPRLVPLLAASFPSARVVDSLDSAALAEVDAAGNLGSLGQHYRRQQDCFAGVTPYLQVPIKEQSLWRDRLRDLPAGLRVGLAWEGGGSLAARRRRSLRLDQLEPLLRLPGVCWVNLQHRHDPVEREAFEARTGVCLATFTGVGDDLLATAALTQALDLVICVQQTALHLAGAVATPAWVLLPRLAEWRYGIAGTEMPWYPSVKLFRQPATGRWQPVIAELTTRLRQHIADHNGVRPTERPRSDAHRL
jgi:hypothetical protein